MTTSSPPGRRARQRQRDPARLRAAIVLIVLIVIAVIVVAVALVGAHPFPGDPSADGSPTPRPCPTATGKKLLLPTKTVHVSVLNGTDRSGLAAQVATALRKRGFKVGTVGNSDSGYSGVAEIRYGSTGLGAARTAYLQFPDASLQRISRTGNRVELVLGTKYSKLSTATQIASLTKKMHANPIC